MGAGVAMSQEAAEVAGDKSLMVYARLERAARKPSLLTCPWAWEHDYRPCGQCDACMLRAALGEVDKVRQQGFLLGDSRGV